MKKDKAKLMNVISLMVIMANVFFILWILYNGINEGFQGTIVEKFAYIALMGLLTLNSILIIQRRKNP